jgi:hypothetical protein
MDLDLDPVGVGHPVRPMHALRMLLIFRVAESIYRRCSEILPIILGIKPGAETEGVRHFISQDC